MHLASVRLASDGQPVSSHVSIDRNILYGDLKRKETLDLMMPTRGRLRGVILYFHGGGFVAANSAVLLQSMTPLVRAGFRVYSANYPLAPECPFPAALISALRALRHVAGTSGADHVALLGDSAGGGLATMLAALVCNHALLEEFARAVGDPSLSHGVGVEITRVGSIYGVVDDEAWRQWQGPGVVPAMWYYGLGAAIASYRSPSFPFRSSLGGLLDEHGDHRLVMPPIYLAVGDCDPLSLSSIKVHRQLCERGIDSTLSIVQGSGHAFHGWPVHWSCGRWKRDAHPVTLELIRFFDGDDSHAQLATAHFDWTFPAVLVLTGVVHACLFAGVVAMLISVMY